MDQKHYILKEYFGHSDFREGQEQIADSLLNGRDALCIMPTGAGKSLCYQIPALIFDGVTLVVSPLISLMKDQVSALVQSGVSAAFLNSSLTQAQYIKALHNMECGKYKLVYVAPERLTAPDFADACKNIVISMVAIDEAHCVSQWGQDFRPGYLKIMEFVDTLPVRPVIGAFTATATNDVREDILRILRLNDPLVVTTGFDRPNLFFAVYKLKDKDLKLLELLSERRGSSGIVYCATRKATEQVCSMLEDNGFSATRYHAGLTEEERRGNQESFVYDRSLIMVATNAFGMGIDKSNVSFVIHYNMPKNIESYYQEAGRAGRDGSAAECILLYSPRDVRTNRFLIDNSEPNADLTAQQQAEVRMRDIERLKYMTFYCTTNDCLRAFILKYFGDRAAQYCGKCSNCLTNFETSDITVDAQKILSCIAKTGQRFGRKIISDVLRAKNNDRIVSLGLESQSTYGIMKDSTAKWIRDIIDYLEENGYLTSDGSEYPVLKLNAASYEILRGRVNLAIKIGKPVKETVKKKDAPVSSSLLDALRALRRELAQRQNVPAYVVFPDAALADMCKKRPTTPEEFLEVNGVGKAKLHKYGKEFIDLIISRSGADS